jgi:hypothetical protein
MLILTLFLLFNLLYPVSIVIPEYPHQALAGGTVIAEMEVVSGKVRQVTVHLDDGAFAEWSRDALAQWRFDSTHNGSELVIVHFRHPALFTFADAIMEISPGNVPDSLAYPLTIHRPVYPANVLARGGVVLRMEINPEGKVDGVDVLQALGGVTETSVRAVREWTFTPAKDGKGKPIPAHAFALFIYRFPVVLPPE